MAETPAVHSERTLSQTYSCLDLIRFLPVHRAQDNRSRGSTAFTRILPSIPQAGKREQLAIIDFETIRLFGIPDLFPFIKSIGGDQTSAELQGIAECGPRCCGLRFSVDCACRDRRMFCPVWNEAPFHQRQLPDSFSWILANYRNRLGGSEVVARNPIVLPDGGIEIFFDQLLSTRKSVAPAHWEIMADEADALLVLLRNQKGQRAMVYCAAYVRRARQSMKKKAGGVLPRLTEAEQDLVWHMGNG